MYAPPKSLPVKFVNQLLEFLSDSDESTADGVLVFVREAVQTYPQLKTHVVAKLLQVFSQIKFLK